MSSLEVCFGFSASTQLGLLYPIFTVENDTFQLLDACGFLHEREVEREGERERERERHRERNNISACAAGGGARGRSCGRRCSKTA